MPDHDDDSRDRDNEAFEKAVRTFVKIFGWFVVVSIVLGSASRKWLDPAGTIDWWSREFAYYTLCILAAAALMSLGLLRIITCDSKPGKIGGGKAITGLVLLACFLFTVFCTRYHK